MTNSELTPAQEYDLLYRDLKLKGDLLEKSIATLERLDDQEEDETVGADLQRAIEYLQAARLAIGDEIIAHYDRLIRANEPLVTAQWP